MKRLAALLIMLIPLGSSAQFAEFSTDTTWLYQKAGGRRENRDRILEMQWILNGKRLTFTSPAIKIKADPNKIDTLLYRNNNNARWDTILCNVSTPGRYQFEYNECCSGFDVLDRATGRRIEGRVVFTLTTPDKRAFLGALGDVGTIVQTVTSDTLRPVCRSPMSPNIYRITFKEIKKCSGGEDCETELCLVERGKSKPAYDFEYKTISTKLEILYMPLGTDPLLVTYDPRRDQIRIK